jgi:hypothetical protein
MREILTEDGYTLNEGDRAFNYYGMKPGYIDKIETGSWAESDQGPWFDFVQDDGTTAYLNGARICTIATAIRLGHMARYERTLRRD